MHQRRRSGEFARAIARLAEEVYPEAQKIQ